MAVIELKSIHPEAIPAALAKAERYRLLNQPRQAESICLDILQAQPEHQEALVMLLLALTDQFGRGYQADIRRAREVLSQLRGEYERAYYEGVACERWAKSLLRGTAPREVGNDWLREAMKCYQRAEPLRPAGNDEAILHWNSCARLINQNESLTAGRREDFAPLLGD
jgi:hypothetical protein